VSGLCYGRSRREVLYRDCLGGGGRYIDEEDREMYDFVEKREHVCKQV